MSSLKVATHEVETITQAAEEASAQIPNALRRFLHATHQQVDVSRALARVATQLCAQSGMRSRALKPERKP